MFRVWLCYHYAQAEEVNMCCILPCDCYRVSDTVTLFIPWEVVSSVNKDVTVCVFHPTNCAMYLNLLLVR